MSGPPLPSNPEFVRFRGLVDHALQPHQREQLWHQLQRKAGRQHCSYEYVIYLLFAQEHRQLLKQLRAAQGTVATLTPVVERWEARVEELAQLLRDNDAPPLPGATVSDTVGAPGTLMLSPHEYWARQQGQEWHTFVMELGLDADTPRSSWGRLYNDAWTQAWRGSPRSPLNQIIRYVRQDHRFIDWEVFGYNMLCLVVPELDSGVQVDLLANLREGVAGEESEVQELRVAYEQQYAQFQRLQVHQVRNNIRGA